MRRGTVRIACSQALALDFLPRQIAAFRAKHPQVSFALKVVDHEWAMAALAALEVDLVVVFRPQFLANFQPMMRLEQRLVAIMAKDPSFGVAQAAASVRLRRLPYGPCRNGPIGGRQLLDEISSRSGLTFNIAAESNSFEMLRGLVIRAGLISFQIKIGTMPSGSGLGVVAREIDDRDVPRANLVLGRLRGRNLPIATAVFAETLSRALESLGPAKLADRRAGRQNIA